MAQFFLRTKRETGESPLYTKIRRNGMQMYICTGIRVDIQEWNKAQKSLAAMRRYENTEEGAKVHDLQMKATKTIDTLYAENKINTKEDKAIIEQALSAIVNGTVEEIQQVAKVATARSRTTVLGFFDYFYAGISDGSIRHGNNSLKQGYMSNTINKKVSCFRKLCNLAAMEGYNKNAVSLRVWKDKAVKEIDKRAEIYLTDEEIDAMYALELTGDNEIVRDIFLLGYFSCQRYSDYCKLREENFITYNKSGLITLTQKKTKKKVEVPIFDDRVYELCEKYHYDFPEIDVQKMNLKIKAVGYELSKTVPSFREKYVTVLSLRKTNVSGFTNWINGPRLEMVPLFLKGTSMVKLCVPNTN